VLVENLHNRNLAPHRRWYSLWIPAQRKADTVGDHAVEVPHIITLAVEIHVLRGYRRVGIQSPGNSSRSFPSRYAGKPRASDLVLSSTRRNGPPAARPPPVPAPRRTGIRAYSEPVRVKAGPVIGRHKRLRVSPETDGATPNDLPGHRCAVGVLCHLSDGAATVDTEEPAHPHFASDRNGTVCGVGVLIPVDHPVLFHVQPHLCAGGKSVGQAHSGIHTDAGG